MNYSLIKKPSMVDSKIMGYLDAETLINLQQTSKFHLLIVQNDPKSIKKISDYKLSIASTLANQAAINTYKAINKNWKYLPNNKELISNVPQSWKIERAMTKNNQIAHILIWDSTSESELSVAIQELINYEMVAECAVAATITRLAIICAVLGKKRTKDWINKLTNNHRLKIDHRLMHELSWSFFKRTDKPKEGEIFAIPFVNIPEYTSFKPNGPDSNFNAIGLSNGKYTSFGSIFQNKEATYEEFEEFLFKNFKKTEDVESTLITQHTNFVNQLTYEIFLNKRRQYQEQVGYFVLNLAALINF